eukprot:2432965-Alexandrium_andersonii.AAC.1
MPMSSPGSSVHCSLTKARGVATSHTRVARAAAPTPHHPAPNNAKMIPASATTHPSISLSFSTVPSASAIQL